MIKAPQEMFFEFPFSYMPLLKLIKFDINRQPLLYTSHHLYMLEKLHIGSPHKPSLHVGNAMVPPINHLYMLETIWFSP